MNWEEKSFYQHTYCISMDDLMDMWVQSMHPFSSVVVIWDAKTHFDILNRCGILVDSIDAYNNKVITIEVPGILEAYELVDNIEKEGYSPFMQVYHKGKLLSDNVGPVV